MRYYLIVGEASGDLHASNLMKALMSEDREADFRYFGGDLMASVGGSLVKHYKDMAYMGFIPVLMHLRTIFRMMDVCCRDILDWKPDVVILVDYPGFNLKVAKYVKRHSNIPIYYYISPKIWAWKEWRIKNIKRDVDELFSILPFEQQFFNRHNYPIHYVGNPSVDSVKAFMSKKGPEACRHLEKAETKPLIALLPGSRKQEIKDNLTRMMKAVEGLDRYNIIVAGAPGIDKSYYSHFVGADVRVEFSKTYELLSQAEAALVTSGTATLETALFRVPQVVCYYMNAGKLFSFLRKLFLKVKYISLVNLIAGREVVKELVADGMTVNAVREELSKILVGGSGRQTMLKEYDRIIDILGEAGASQRAARKIISLLTRK